MVSVFITMGNTEKPKSKMSTQSFSHLFRPELELFHSHVSVGGKSVVAIVYSLSCMQLLL